MAVSLSKGGPGVSLAKAGSSNQIICGLGWDPKSGHGEIDLDANLVMFGAMQPAVKGGLFGGGKPAQREALATVYYGKLSGPGVQHTGDNLTGEGDGDDEQIKIDLDKVPANVESMVVSVTSYSGDKFSNIANAFCRVVDQRNNAEVIRYDLAESPNNTAMVMVAIKRDGQGGWTVNAVGAPCNGGTVNKIMNEMAAAA